MKKLYLKNFLIILWTLIFLYAIYGMVEYFFKTSILQILNEKYYDILNPLSNSFLISLFILFLFIIKKFKHEKKLFEFQISIFLIFLIFSIYQSTLSFVNPLSFIIIDFQKATPVFYDSLLSLIGFSDAPPQFHEFSDSNLEKKIVTTTFGKSYDNNYYNSIFSKENYIIDSPEKFNYLYPILYDFIKPLIIIFFITISFYIIYIIILFYNQIKEIFFKLIRFSIFVMIFILYISFLRLEGNLNSEYHHLINTIHSYILNSAILLLFTLYYFSFTNYKLIKESFKIEGNLFKYLLSFLFFILAIEIQEIFFILSYKNLYIFDVFIIFVLIYMRDKIVIKNNDALFCAAFFIVICAELSINYYIFDYKEINYSIKMISILIIYFYKDIIIRILSTIYKQ